jgi:hypothetical protein
LAAGAAGGGAGAAGAAGAAASRTAATATMVVDVGVAPRVSGEARAAGTTITGIPEAAGATIGPGRRCDADQQWRQAGGCQQERRQAGGVPPSVCTMARPLLDDRKRDVGRPAEPARSLL